MKPWNGWYHINGNTYGTWLRGDQRGWRARHHREHCEGDYKNPPPPGQHDGLLARSRNLMKHNPVLLDVESRQIAGQAMVEMLLHQKIEVIALALDAKHFHVLAKFPDTRVRPRIGRAKKHAYFELRSRGRKDSVWAIRTRVLPVRNREHQVRVFRYIEDHAKRGAWLWTFRNRVY